MEEHTHRFAIWTAARAVQRSWTNTSTISQVIQSTELQKLVDTYKYLSEQRDFDHIHKNLCNTMINRFKLLNVDATYGRAAKIIAIYLKTSVIIGADILDNEIIFIHPPIDRILLKNLPKGIKEFEPIRELNWTQLKELDYWKMVDTIRGKLGFFDWRLEKFWRPEV